MVGDWCPGWERQPAHLSADLTADHVKEVAAGGKPDGRLVVRCRSCNAARSAHLARRALSALVSKPVPHRQGPPIDPAPAALGDTHRAAGDEPDPGPVAA
jgi:hypothetical protein